MEVLRGETLYLHGWTHGFLARPGGKAPLVDRHIVCVLPIRMPRSRRKYQNLSGMAENEGTEVHCVTTTRRNHSLVHYRYEGRLGASAEDFKHILLKIVIFNVLAHDLAWISPE